MMFGIPLPWIIIGVMVSLFGTYRGGYHFGWSDRDAEMQIAIAKKNEEARELEKSMTSKLSDQESKLRKAQDEIVKKQSAMHELARTGRLRLPTASCPQTSANPATPAGNSPDASELERQTITALIDIAAEGDKAITKLNSCIAAYNEVRNLVNGQ
jgi:mannitol/fructose-specific phosphotransferase system IIA component